jgi:hypothetical protein
VGWWHAYGAAVDGLAVDPDGHDRPAWVFVVVADSPVPPADPAVRTDYDWPHAGGAPPAPPLPYLASWDHAPTDAERDAVTPPEYREPPDG